MMEGRTCLLGSRQAGDILPAHTGSRVQHLPLYHLAQPHLLLATKPSPCMAIAIITPDNR